MEKVKLTAYRDGNTVSVRSGEGTTQTALALIHRQQKIRRIWYPQHGIVVETYSPYTFMVEVIK